MRVRGKGEDGEDAGIRMVVADAADRVEFVEVVFEGVVVSVPGDDVKWGAFTFSLIQHPVLLHDKFERSIIIGVVCCGDLKVTSVCETVRTDGTEFRELIVRVGKGFEDVAASFTIRQCNVESDSTRDYDDFGGPNEEATEFSGYVEGSMLRDDKEVAVGV